MPVFPGHGSIQFSNKGLAGSGVVRREEELSRLDEFDARESGGGQTHATTNMNAMNATIIVTIIIVNSNSRS